MKRTLLLILIFLPMLASAQNAVEIDGIYYNLKTEEKTAEVTQGPYQYYKGDVAIPESVTYDDVVYNVTSIGELAFSECRGLISITIPDGVTLIGESAFDHCSGLTSVAIPNSVTSIGEIAFSYCRGLTSVTIPNSVTSIGELAFSYCSSLTSIKVEAENTKYDSRDNCNAIIETESNTLIAGCQKTTIPNSVTAIGEYAFYGCDGLTSVIIPNGVTSIGDFAFYDCIDLTSVTIPNGTTSIGDYAFQYCSGLTSIAIGNGVTSIGKNAFIGCSGLISIDIPEGVTSIGDCAFLGCSGLTSITIPNSVISIRRETFSGCSGLTSITIPGSVNSIGFGAFAGCNGLTSITIPNSVIEIGGYAFSQCSSLSSVTIPNSMTSIGSGAFYDCSALTSITIPDCVTSIGGSAFQDCSGLTSVTIGSGVTSIGALAFASCSGMSDLFCRAKDVPNTGLDVFHNCKKATLHVPSVSIEAYKAAEPWNQFMEIVALPQEYFPEGTKWTEIRLDTLKYDSWYSKVGDEWVPNFETIEYYVKGEYIEKRWDDSNTFKKVYTNGPEWTDSLTLLIQEGEQAEYIGHNSVLVSVLSNSIVGEEPFLLIPGTAYQFDWSVGKGIYFEDITYSNTTGIPRYYCYYGIIDKIKEDYFGGVRPLKYVDLDGKAPECGKWDSPQNVDTQGGRIIQGIGITEWNDGECLFGPPDPYFALYGSNPERHYRSMLVHFERNGEVLYDIWPEVMPQDDYIPFVKDGKGKIWHVVRSDLNSSDTEQYMLAYEDVVKDGKTYLKMCRSMGDRTEIQDVGLFREEDRKVYFIAPDMQEEHLMFDFSLKEGDTYETYSYDEEKVVSYEVVSVEDYLEGPEYIHYIEKEDGLITQHRYLRKWTVCRTDDKSIKVWIEGVGSLEGPLGNLHDVVLPGLTKDYLAYVEDAYAEDPDYDNLYLPFTINDVYGHVHGCDLPTEADNPEYDEHHRLTYELEGERLHVYGEVFGNCGPNQYAYFREKPTDDPLVHKIEFEIQEVAPLYWCEGLHATDFYVSGFDPNLNYIVVDNQGMEHQVINKTQQMAYRPFVEDGKGWKVGYGSDNPIQFVEYYYFDNDTIIDGKVCKQMMCQRYVSPDYPEYDAVSQQPSLRYVGAWYEEDKKVYVYNTTDKQFKLMYDFSVDDNATLQIHGQSYVIGPKQSGGIKGFKGIYRDVMMPWDEEQSIYNTTWLEGVGGIEGPKFNVYLGKEYHGGAFLMSCTVGDEVIYLNDDYEDGATPDGARKRRFDFTHTIKIQPKARITRNRSGAESEESLYGEYNEQQLSIYLDPIDDTYLVSITSESGKPVYEKDINAGNIVGLNIDISSYSESRYTVTVENSRESFTGIFGAGNADVDGDGILTAKDIIAIINVISGKTTDEALKSAADVNSDGVVDAADIIRIASKIVRK